MSTSVQIHYIAKNPRLDRFRRIEAVGGVHNGVNWRIDLQSAINFVKVGTYRFYTHVNGNSSWVVVATSEWGNEYLKTEADTTNVDNLLSLPEFPPYFPVQAAA
ncbi:MAG: DUF3892 domain-containing protein [Polaromonas sp.]|uniref:DUF3892 domain-containing protein n=1 Tax=Polaromonas sp. TaxID=1869339 RepID=UPI00181FEFAA|nr:DUF3892 domain-containing protein [Polaromonas sp.]MBA3594032.1 DUF3892 domain-containing protein [Polaromonas sp.]